MLFIQKPIYCNLLYNTESPPSQPPQSSSSLLNNGSESIHVLYECEKGLENISDINEIMLQKKDHKNYNKVKDKRKQRVRYSDLVYNGNDDDGAIVGSLDYDERSVRQPLLPKDQ